MVVGRRSILGIEAMVGGDQSLLLPRRDEASIEDADGEAKR
jgi:hypothetical protein